MAEIGHSSVIRLGDGAGPEVFTTLGEVKSISGPSFGRDAVDSTHMASANRYRTFISGLRDAGEVTFSVNTVPSSVTDDALKDAYNDDDPRGIRVEFPDGSRWNADAILTNYSNDIPLDDIMVTEVTFKLTGQPTFTEAA